jgi:hypothetical protein
MPTATFLFAALLRKSATAAGTQRLQLSSFSPVASQSLALRDSCREEVRSSHLQIRWSRRNQFKLFKMNKKMLVIKKFKISISPFYLFLQTIKSKALNYCKLLILF